MEGVCAGAFSADANPLPSTLCLRSRRREVRSVIIHLDDPVWSGNPMAAIVPMKTALYERLLDRRKLFHLRN